MSNLAARRRIGAGLIVSAFVPMLAQADFASLSGESAINGSTLGHVMQPQVAVGPQGDSIVVFQGARSSVRTSTSAATTPPAMPGRRPRWSPQ